MAVSSRFLWLTSKENTLFFSSIHLTCEDISIWCFFCAPSFLLQKIFLITEKLIVLSIFAMYMYWTNMACHCSVGTGYTWILINQIQNVFAEYFSFISVFHNVPHDGIVVLDVTSCYTAISFRMWRTIFYQCLLGSEFHLESHEITNFVHIIISMV
jgi:hypothetical protein